MAFSIGFGGSNQGYDFNVGGGGFLTGGLAGLLSPSREPGVAGGLRAFLNPGPPLARDAHQMAMKDWTEAEAATMPAQREMLSLIDQGDLQGAGERLDAISQEFAKRGLPVGDLHQMFEQKVQATARVGARRIPIGQPDTLSEVARLADSPGELRATELQRQQQAASEANRLQTIGETANQAAMAPLERGEVTARTGLLQEQTGAIPSEIAARTAAAGASRASAGEAGIRGRQIQQEMDILGQTGYKPGVAPAPPRPSTKPRQFLTGSGYPVEQIPGDPNLYLRAPTTEEDKAGITMGPEDVQRLINAGVATQDAQGRLRYTPSRGEAAPAQEAPPEPAPHKAGGISNREFINQPAETLPQTPEAQALMDQTRREITALRQRYSGTALKQRIAALLARLRPQGVPEGQ